MLTRASFTTVLAVLVAATLSLVSQAAPPAGNSAVEVVDKAGYEKILARHKGKVILVDCWATWCVPCIKAFPKTVELSERYRKDGLVVVSLSFDTLKNGQAPPKVVEFLQEKKADFDNLISRHDIGEDGADVFKIDDGALPHFKLYGRDGRLLRAFASGDDEKTFTHEDIEQAVKAALTRR